MIRHFQEHKSKALTQAKAASADCRVLDPGGQRQGSWQRVWGVGLWVGRDVNLGSCHPCSEGTPHSASWGHCPLGIDNLETWPRAAWIDLEEMRWRKK